MRYPDAPMRCPHNGGDLHMRLPHLEKLVTTTVALGLTATLAACGTPPSTAPSVGQGQGQTSTVAQPWDGLIGSEREQALLAAAKNEGELTVYSAFNDEQDGRCV